MRLTYRQLTNASESDSIARTYARSHLTAGRACKLHRKSHDQIGWYQMGLGEKTDSLYKYRLCIMSEVGHMHCHMISLATPINLASIVATAESSKPQHIPSLSGQGDER